MNDRPLRPRKPVKIRSQPVVDNLEFKKNKCSDKANYITTIVENINIHLWYDKHYHLREQLGDENGKRNGIAREDIQSLVFTSIKHMMFYSSVLPSFTYLNHNYKREMGRAHRLVCQSNNLHVIIEAHMISVNAYEVTVITAMNKENFILSDGQYVIELLDDDLSVLKFSRRGKVGEIYNL